MLEAETLAQIRTGAASGVATKYLARPESRVMTLFGAGWQARAQLDAISRVLPALERVNVVGRSSERVQRFCGDMGKRLQLNSNAQEKYPNRPIRMLVTFSAGSLTDILARLVGAKMSENWGQQAVIDNRPGGGGIAASQALIAANADGYTLMMVSSGHAVSATLYSKLPYDTLRDFAGVSQVVSGGHVLAVSKDLGVKSVKELLVPAKTPRPLVNQLSREVARILELPDVNERIVVLGSVPQPSTPEQFDAFIRSEVQKLGKVVKAANLRID